MCLDVLKEIPSIHLNESEIRRKENESFAVLCSAEGEPKPMVH